MSRLPRLQAACAVVAMLSHLVRSAPISRGHAWVDSLLPRGEFAGAGVYTSPLSIVEAEAPKSFLGKLGRVISNKLVMDKPTPKMAGVWRVDPEREQHITTQYRHPQTGALVAESYVKSDADTGQKYVKTYNRSPVDESNWNDNRITGNDIHVNSSVAHDAKWRVNGHPDQAEKIAGVHYARQHSHDHIIPHYGNVRTIKTMQADGRVHVTTTTTPHVVHQPLDGGWWIAGKKMSEQEALSDEGAKGVSNGKH